MDHTKKLPDDIALYLHLFHDFPGYIKKKNEVVGLRTKNNWAITLYRIKEIPDDVEFKEFAEAHILTTLSGMEYLFFENRTLIVTASGCLETEIHFERYAIMN